MNFLWALREIDNRLGSEATPLKISEFVRDNMNALCSAITRNSGSLGADPGWWVTQYIRLRDGENQIERYTPIADMFKEKIEEVFNSKFDTRSLTVEANGIFSFKFLQRYALRGERPLVNIFSYNDSGVIFVKIRVSNFDPMRDY